MNLSEVQQQQKEWQERNFGVEPNSHRCLLGMTEEIGELVAAETVADKVDAIGDALIYMIGYCNDWGIEFKKLLFKATPFHPVAKSHKNLLLGLGSLSHAHLKMEQKIRMNEDHSEVQFDALVLILVQLMGEAFSLSVDIRSCLEDTWSTVMQRDWQKNNVDGQAT